MGIILCCPFKKSKTKPLLTIHDFDNLDQTKLLNESVLDEDYKVIEITKQTNKKIDIGHDVVFL